MEGMVELDGENIIGSFGGLVFVCAEALDDNVSPCTNYCAVVAFSQRYHS